MIARRQFLKGATAAGTAASVLGGVAVRADMAPEPEKPKAWHGFAEFREIPLTGIEPNAFWISGAGKRRFRATSVFLEFKEIQPYPPLELFWPIDIRYGTTSRPFMVFPVDGKPFWQETVVMGRLDQWSCMGQHFARPHVPLNLKIPTVTIESNESFVVCMITTSPLIVTGRVELQEILPQRLIDF